MAKKKVKNGRKTKVKAKAKRKYVWKNPKQKNKPKRAARRTWKKLIVDDSDAILRQIHVASVAALVPPEPVIVTPEPVITPPTPAELVASICSNSSTSNLQALRQSQPLIAALLTRVIDGQEQVLRGQAALTEALKNAL